MTYLISVFLVSTKLETLSKELHLQLFLYESKQILLGYFHHYGALYTLLEKLTALLVYTFYGAGSMIGVGSAASGAVEFSRALTAFITGVGIAGAKLIAKRNICNTVPDISKPVAFIAYKLMTWIEISPWCDGHILGA